MLNVFSNVLTGVHLHDAFYSHNFASNVTYMSPILNQTKVKLQAMGPKAELFAIIYTTGMRK